MFYVERPLDLRRHPIGRNSVPIWGQQEVFDQGSETLLEKLNRPVDVSAKQIERMSHVYGQLVECYPQRAKEGLVVEEERPTYGMMDGSMV